VITKLSPNVTDAAVIAKAAQDAGSDAVSLVNTFTAMAVDIRTKQSKLGNVTGGLSGPAIKPIALYMVWKTYRSVGIPVIGMGGIISWQDAIEFILCGASAVMLGTANFVNPKTPSEVIEGIKSYLKAEKAKGIKDIVGRLHVL
jgi:dihydroorotate dehydrogenase (NAD+) catalytic subunit